MLQVLFGHLAAWRGAFHSAAFLRRGPARRARFRWQNAGPCYKKLLFYWLSAWLSFQLADAPNISNDMVASKNRQAPWECAGWVITWLPTSGLGFHFTDSQRCSDNGGQARPGRTMEYRYPSASDSPPGPAMVWGLGAKHMILPGISLGSNVIFGSNVISTVGNQKTAGHSVGAIGVVPRNLAWGSESTDTH